MQDDQFDRFAVAALSAAGAPLREGDLDLLRFVNAAFGPAIAALDAVDLRELDPEPALDPSGAP
jgi:hypothetical protein